MGLFAGEDGTVVFSPGSFNNQIVNYGRIGGSVSFGSGQDRVANRGLITGSVDLNDGNNRVDNRRGVIEGSVSFGNGNNEVDNRRGLIEGRINFGDGADRLRPGAGIEDAFGGGGVDTLDFSGSAAVKLALDNSIAAMGDAADDIYNSFENITGSRLGSDELIGDQAANTIVGLGGSDRLIGQAGDDFLDGGFGNDRMDGGTGNDTLIDESGSDTLVGNFGVDTIRAGEGNDFITGGPDRDVMTGGTGSDRFIFQVRDFVGINQSTPDRITDFRSSERDIIDLAGVDASSAVTGDQAFTFIGTGPFTNVAGQLRFQQIAGTTFVYGDTNGDGASDFTIALDGALTLTAADFVL